MDQDVYFRFFVKEQRVKLNDDNQNTQLSYRNIFDQTRFDIIAKKQQYRKIPISLDPQHHNKSQQLLYAKHRPYQSKSCRPISNPPQQAMQTFRQKLMSLWKNKLSTGQMFFFLLGKVCFLLVQMPRHQKQSSIIIELILASIFYTLSITFKILQFKTLIMQKLPNMCISSFLPIVIGLLVMMFTFALEDKLKFIFFEKMLTMLVITLQIFCLIFLSHPKFITKREFVFYQVVLALNVLILADKCIWFLTYEDQANIKDILLLALTTQIAFSIVFMEYLNETYKERRKLKIVEFKEEDTVKRQLELEMTS